MATPLGPKPRSGSSHAGVRMASPLAILGSHSWRCSSVEAFSEIASLGRTGSRPNSAIRGTIPAVDTVILTIQNGVPVARIELLDEAQIDAINKYSKLDHQVAPTLFFEFHGTEAGVAEQTELVKAIAAEHGGDDFRWATTPEARSKLWQARHDAYYAALALRPGSKGWPTDVCVPISRLAECIAETKRDLAQSPIPYALVGHVGDGNFHLVFMLDPNRPEELIEASRLNERMVNRALAMEGTSTGEHGIGYGKMDFLVAEHGEAVSVMRMIKKALDPDGILNPGKIVRI